MDPHNNPDQYDFWSGDLPPNASPHPNGNQYPYNTFNAPTADTQAGPAFAGPFTHEYSNISRFEDPSSPLGEYAPQFRTHPLAYPSAPPDHAPIAFDDIVNMFALYPNEPSSSAQDSVDPTPHQSTPLGPTPVQIPTSRRLSLVPFEGHSTSASAPDSMHGNFSVYSDSADPHRATPGSYGGPSQSSSHNSLPPPAFNTTPNLGFGHPSHVESRGTSRGPSRTRSLPVGPGQHIIQFNLDNHGHLPAGHPPSIHPPSVPFPASPSEDSFSSSSPTPSPAMSTSSLPNPPSSSTMRGGTLSWRVIDSSDVPGWSCDCESKTKKKKRHLESCPRNPNKPTIECPCCSRIFIGGSRKSALKKHMKRFHKDFLNLLKKNKD